MKTKLAQKYALKCALRVVDSQIVVEVTVVNQDTSEVIGYHLPLDIEQNPKKVASESKDELETRTEAEVSEEENKDGN